MDGEVLDLWELWLLNGTRAKIMIMTEEWIGWASVNGIGRPEERKL